MDFIRDIFLYRQDAPLLFTRLYFWVFLLVAIGIYSFIYKQKALRNLFLFAISLFFYYKTSGLFFLLLVFTTLANYLLGLAIYRYSSRPSKCELLTLFAHKAR